MTSPSPCGGLCRPDRDDEPIDLAGQRLRLMRKLLSRLEHLPRRRSGIGCSLLDADDRVRHLLRARCRLLHIARDRLRGRTLFLHRRCNAGCDVIDLADRLGDALDGRDRLPVPPPGFA